MPLRDERGILGENWSIPSSCAASHAPAFRYAWRDHDERLATESSTAPLFPGVGQLDVSVGTGVALEWPKSSTGLSARRVTAAVFLSQCALDHAEHHHLLAGCRIHRAAAAVWNRTLDQSGWLDSLAFLLALLSAPGGPGAHYGAGRPGREYGAEPLSGPHLASAEYGAVHPLDAGGRQWLVGPVHPQHALEPLDLGVSGLGIFCGARVDRHRLYTLAPICPRLPGVVRPTGTRAYSTRSSPWPTSGSRCAHRSPDAPNGTPADGAGTA